ncbi:MAG TPA: ribonuclease III, partial [Nocardioidaceae bacterium]
MGEPSYDDLRAALGNPELEAELLERALTHRSFAYENGGLPTNERLEFLGDSVLGVVVTDTL